MDTKFKYSGHELDYTNLGVNIDSISFYSELDDDGGIQEQNDVEFGHCELSGIKGNLVTCVALTAAEGELVEFQVLDVFVHGDVDNPAMPTLGALSGAF